MKADPDISRKQTGSSFFFKAIDFALSRDNDHVVLHLGYAVFALFTLFMAFHHVPWRDEATAWLYARDLNLVDLFYMTRHDGHPGLWWLGLKAVQATGANYLGMMVLNWAFCASGIWLLFYRSALPLAARLGVAFAPICLLEVAFTGRNYAIAMPLCFLAAVLYRTVEQKPLRYAFVLALMASTNVYAAAVFVGISFQFLLEQAFAFGTQPFSLRPLYTKYLVANLILSTGALLLVLQVAPIHFPGDPFPFAKVHDPNFYWLLDRYLLVVLLTPVALMLFARMPRNPPVVGGVPIALLATVPAVFYGIMGRHFFMLNLGLIYFCWIYLDSFLRAETHWGMRLGSNGVRFLITVLIAAAIYVPSRGCFGKALHPPYDSRNAAQAIIQNGLDRPDTLFVSTDPFRAASLLIFFKNIHDDYVPPRFGPSPQTFVLTIYVPMYFKPIPSLEEMKPLVMDLAKRNPTKTILVVSTGAKPANDPPGDDPSFPLVCLYQTPLSPHLGPDDESYRVYVMKPAPQNP